ncbi:MAG: hypothetical protein KKD38_05175, partial [Candidatus Delongbacteria bacterium]|nr:hypothetical protein [Candidatus Delongbacteria bacterium]MCG2759629.1 hypothetical protein [Candidatus Delongbacteria bacterium]
MIVKMTRYSFLIYHKEYDKFLNDLQNIGVVHIIEKSDELAEDVRNKINLIKRIDSTVKHLKTRVFDGKFSYEIRSDADNLKAIDETEKISLDIDQNHQKLHQLNKELHYQEPWGNFSIETVNKLQQAGIVLKFFIVSSKSFDESWKEKYSLEIIKQFSGNTYFAVFHKTGETIEIKADEIKIFDRSISEIKNEIHKVKEKIGSDNKQL